MTDYSAITPPPELVQQWIQQSTTAECTASQVATLAAQWGADQELEACCEWLSNEVLCESNVHRFLRAARRPKPPSLKGQALKELAWVAEHLDMPLHNRYNAIHTIHRALEQLDD